MFYQSGKYKKMWLKVQKLDYKFGIVLLWYKFGN